MENFWGGIWSRLLNRRSTTTKPKAKSGKKASALRRGKVLPPQEISIRKKQSILLPIADTAGADQKMQLQLEAVQLGFIFSDSALSSFASIPSEREEVFNVLQSLVASNKVWKPMYPGFPKQVYSLSQAELFFNAIAHYHTSGHWKPEYVKESRLPLNEKVKLKKIDLIQEDDFKSIFSDLLSSNSSLSEVERDIVFSFLSLFKEDEIIDVIPSSIPFKETLCQLVADAFDQGMKKIASIKLNTATDVLRVATRLSGGDVSLAENTKFKLSRPSRRWLIEVLESVAKEEDFVRHANKWKRLFYCFHIGSVENAPKCRSVANKLRNGKLKSENTQIEKALENKSLSELLEILAQKPGEFARRIDHVLRIFTDTQGKKTLDEFFKVLNGVDTRVLIQLYGHLKHRDMKQSDREIHGTRGVEMTRVALPKGQIAQVKVLKDTMPAIDAELLDLLLVNIKKNLVQRFSKLPPLGKSWVDPKLAKCPAPLQMRNAAEGLKVVQRGSRLPMLNKNILRFFVHWVGYDIDLSAVFLTHKLKFHSEIAYYELRRDKNKSGYSAVHSGDITYAPAPDGACEFIDIDLDSISDKSIRYIAMDVRVYEGPPFPNQQANAGWMFRENLGEAGEIFDATTVDQRVSIGASSYTCMVAIFDIVDREVIWLDLMGSSKALRSGNNVTRIQLASAIGGFILNNI